MLLLSCGLLLASALLVFDSVSPRQPKLAPVRVRVK